MSKLVLEVRAKVTDRETGIVTYEKDITTREMNLEHVVEVQQAVATMEANLAQKQLLEINGQASA